MQIQSNITSLESKKADYEVVFKDGPLGFTVGANSADAKFLAVDLLRSAAESPRAE